MSEKRDFFCFRHFCVKHSNSTMKVGTDAMLLGAWVSVHKEVKSILDVGTGSGVLALMMAQKSTATITAIDIDESSVIEAHENFAASPWHDRLSAKVIAFQELIKNTSNKFDFIISNPPFYQNSLLPANQRKKIAKHTIYLSLQEFFQCANCILEKHGFLALIIPFSELEGCIKIAHDSGLFAVEKLIVFSSENKQANRMCILLSRNENEIVKTSKLVIRKSNGGYTDDYKKLTADFHSDGYL